MIDWGEVLQWAMFIFVVVAAVVALMFRGSNNETSKLAHTRGEANDDLRDEVADLTRRLAIAEAEIIALHKERNDLIIDAVVDGVEAGLGPLIALELHKIKGITNA